MLFCARQYLKPGPLKILFVATLLILESCAKTANSKPSDTAGTDMKFAVANVLQSNMVVQRDKPFNVWGTAKPGTRVSTAVSWNSEHFITNADASGKWTVTVPAKGMVTLPQTVTVAAEGEDTVIFNNILLGDVWICAGQSNMVMPLAPGYNGSFAGVTVYQSEIAAANYPHIRELTVATNPQSNPAIMLGGKPKWNIVQPEVAGSISAVSFYFSRKIYLETKVPIGIVIAGVNGTKCQLWSPADVFQNSELKAVYGNGEKESMLYNGMIYPLHRLAIKGFIWYQGESNWSDEPSSYAKLNAAMIESWRRIFNQGMLPFYITQVAPFAKDHNTEPGGGDPTLFDYALFREGQTLVPTLVNSSGMAVTVDAGDVYLLHPPGKKQVGERLAFFALKNEYGKTVNPLAPTLKAYTQTGNKVYLTFENASGLKTTNSQPLKQLFFVADDSRVFVNANAKISGSGIVLTVPAGIAQVKAIRYAFTNSAVSNLQNEEGLPVMMFRTDKW